jgi:anti-sigma factor RsiW
MSMCLKKGLLLAVADCELPSGEMELAERHIAVCAACKQQLESIRATSVRVSSLLSSLAPEETAGADAMAVVRIPYGGASSRMRWTAVVSVGVLVAALLLFALIRRQHSAPTTEFVKAVAPVQSVEKKETFVSAVTKPAHVGSPIRIGTPTRIGTTKTPLKVRQFQALDDGEPIETGMIYRVSLPASSSPSGTAQQSAKRIPAEVIVDEFGKVRAIRFVQ